MIAASRSNPRNPAQPRPRAARPEEAVPQQGSNTTVLAGSMMLLESKVEKTGTGFWERRTHIFDFGFLMASAPL
jgi:hypothetical protein